MKELHGTAKNKHICKTIIKILLLAAAIFIIAAALYGTRKQGIHPGGRRYFVKEQSETQRPSESLAESMRDVMSDTYDIDD